MKKTLLSAIMLSLSSLAVASPAPVPFDGFYLGAGIGGSNSNFNINETVDLEPVDLTSGTPIFNIQLPHNASIYADSFVGNFDAGWGKVFHKNLYLGIEVNDTVQDLESSDVMNVNELNSMLSIGTNTDVELKNQVGVTLDPGIIFHQDTLLYGKIGPAWGHFNVSGSANYAQAIFTPVVLSADSSYDQDLGYECGLMLGIGMEHYISQHFTLRLEYDHTDYGALTDINNSGSVVSSDPGVPLGGEITNDVDVDGDQNQILLSLNYYFT